MTAAGDVRFIAEVAHVKELSLTAAAGDPDFWRARLAGEKLYPYAVDGAAEVALSATDLLWMGQRTRELTIGLAVSARTDAATRDGLYLAQAFNSSRLFAWMERAFFNTPYEHGRLEFSDQPPARSSLSDSAGLIARLQPAATTPVREEEEMWQGTIYLPGGRTFVARLGGHTHVFPPDPADTITFGVRDRYPIFQWLLDCGLAPREWRVRHDALHARTRTFMRPR